MHADFQQLRLPRCLSFPHCSFVFRPSFSLAESAPIFCAVLGTGSQSLICGHKVARYEIPASGLAVLIVNHV